MNDKGIFSLNIAYKRPNIKELSYLALFLTKKGDSGFCADTRWLRRAHLVMGMMPISVSSAGKFCCTCATYDFVNENII